MAIIPPNHTSRLPPQSLQPGCTVYSIFLQLNFKSLVELKMQKRTKNINLLFIWLIGLIFFAHGITPHHHHFDPVIEQHQNENNQNGQNEDNPLHCHAFNDLVMDKPGASFSNISVPDTFTAVNTESDLRFRIAENPCGIINTTNRDKICPDDVFSDLTPARGSPALV